MQTISATTMLGALCLAAALPATAQVKVGFVAPMSGPQAIVGQDQYDGFTLGLDLLNNKLGGQAASVLKEDDQVKPEVGSELVRKLIERDKVDAIVGLSFTNVLMASKRWIAQSGTVAIATNAGPSALAGEECMPNMFVTAWQSDGPSEAMGKFVKDKGHKKVYLLAPNYQAGKDMLTGFKRFYGSQPHDEVYTQINQTDYSAEISQIQSANPDAVFVFYPGSMGINFVKQMSQAGLLGKIPMYSVFTVDATTMPALRDAANGATMAGMWDAGLDNPENKKFVAAFEAKYKRVPSPYAAAAFDAANLLDAAVRKAGPQFKDKKVLAAAMKTAGASFKSVRGPFSFNNNNMPIQNYYVFKVGREAGKLDTRLIATPLSNHADAYPSRCRAGKS